MRAYLMLLQVEVTAFHPRLNWLVSVALFVALYLAAFSTRPLAVTLLYGVRTFLPHVFAYVAAAAQPASTGIILWPH